MPDWGNIAYGVEMGNDAFQEQQTQRRALDAGSLMFEKLGSEEALGFAQLMRENPDDAAMMAAQFGGLPSLYQTFRANAGLNIDPLKMAELGIQGYEAESGRMTAEAAQTKAEAEAAQLPEKQRIERQKADAATLRAQRTGMQQPAKAPHTVDQESTLRDDFMKASAVPEFITRSGAYRTAEAGFDLDNAAGDIQLVYNTIKLWDPTAVREGEIALARDVASLPAQLRDAWNLVIGGRSRLARGAARQLLNSARSSMRVAVSNFDDFRDPLRQAAESQALEYPGLDPERAIPDYAKTYRKGGKNEVKPDFDLDKMGEIRVPKNGERVVERGTGRIGTVLSDGTVEFDD